MGTLRSVACVIASALILSQAAFAEQSSHSASEHLVDLSRSHWGHHCVVKVVDTYPIMQGFQDHTFRGDWTVNRYELAAAVAKTFNYLQSSQKLSLPVLKTSYSTGVSPDHWAFPYVRKLAQENGLMSMLIQNGSFNGDQVVSRKELAYALSELLSLIESSRKQPLMNEKRVSELAIDLKPRSPYQQSIHQALNQYQFMSLYADNSFRPEAPVTRYALAASLCKVFEAFETEAPTTQAQNEMN